MPSGARSPLRLREPRRRSLEQREAAELLASFWTGWELETTVPTGRRAAGATSGSAVVRSLEITLVRVLREELDRGVNRAASGLIRRPVQRR